MAVQKSCEGGPGYEANTTSLVVWCPDLYALPVKFSKFVESTRCRERDYVVTSLIDNMCELPSVSGVGIGSNQQRRMEFNSALLITHNGIVSRARSGPRD